MDCGLKNMGKIQKFEDILAWQKARELTREVYGHSKTGGFAKDFGLKDQIQRASVSIMGNVAEGFDRGGDKEFIQFLSVSKGSCGKVKSHLYVASDQQCINSAQFNRLYNCADEVGRLAWTVDWRPWTADWSLVPFHFWSLCFFVLGCMTGSFLNVCIHRMPLGMSIVTPRSHCPHCQYSIPWYLNIPLVTWLALRGRCKNCAAPISPRYFIVELMTGVAFLGCWLAFGKAAHPLQSLPLVLAYAVFLAGLIVAAFIDFEHLIIPDEITLGGMAVGVVASFLIPSLHGANTFIAGLGWGFVGAVVGAGTVYTILRLGKWLFGRQRVKLPLGSRIVFGETAMYLPGKEIPYEDLF